MRASIACAVEYGSGIHARKQRKSVVLGHSQNVNSEIVDQMLSFIIEINF